jgi:hypothetical protein
MCGFAALRLGRSNGDRPTTRQRNDRAQSRMIVFEPKLAPVQMRDRLRET